VRTEMRLFSERNPVVVGAIGLALTAAAVIGSLQYKQLPFFDSATQYSAYFAEAGGQLPGAAVHVRASRSAMCPVSSWTGLEYW
jgi:phospholipid/cholesterol/gamma-HCH transport system substrate-binding protein